MHGEVTHDDIDIFDREAAFIDTVLDPLRRAIPELRVIMEHITTKNGVIMPVQAGIIWARPLQPIT